MPDDARSYLSASFKKLSANNDFMAAIEGILPHAAQDRVAIALEMIKELARL